jgi:hypothetical protein
MRETVTDKTIDIDQLIEEAKHGFLSIPLAQLPPSVRALLMPALEEGEHRVIAEQRDGILHRREIQQSERIKDWLENKSPEYQKAYEEFFETVANSESKLDRGLSDMNESETQLRERFADVERRAVQLPDGRLAFYENGHFVYEDGGPVGSGNLKACERAKKDADETNTPLASRQEYLALKNALADTVETEQRLCGVSEVVQRSAEQVRADPPEAKSDLDKSSAAIKRETDEAVAQARSQIASNKDLITGQYRTDNPKVVGPVNGPISMSFNSSVTGKSAASPKPADVELQQLTAMAMSGPG